LNLAPAPEPPTPSREPEQETLDTATPFPHTINGVTIHQGDCRLVLAEMAPESVDLIITNPPYNVGVDYNGYNDSLPLGI
jgi:DNA modification methylase